MKKEELIGKVIGKWKILNPTNGKRYYYDCKCLGCGEIKSIKIHSILNGKSKQCRQCGNKVLNPRVIHNEILKKTFERLLVTGWTVRKRDNETVYTCRCECGNETTASYHDLLSGNKKSCGCLKIEVRRETIKNTFDNMRATHKKARIDGSSAVSLNAKVSKNSKTGVSGVSQMKDGRYRAYITVARRQKHLGVFGTIEEAIVARKNAEEKYHRPIIEKFQQIKENNENE